MAKVIYSPIVSDVSGKLGGVVFHKSQFGNIVRSHTSQVNPSTLLQSKYRIAFSYLSSVYRIISEINKQKWSDYAATVFYKNSQGVSYNLSGFQMFMKVNLNQLSAGNDYVSSPPNFSGYISPAYDYTAVSVNSFTLFFNESAMPTGNYVSIYCTPPQSPGVRYISESLLRYVYTFDALNVGRIYFKYFYETMFENLSGLLNHKIGMKLSEGVELAGVRKSKKEQTMIVLNVESS